MSRLRASLGPRYKLPDRPPAPDLLEAMTPPRRSGTISVRVPPDLAERVRSFASDEGDTISDFVERALRYEIQRISNAKHKGMGK